MTPSSGPVEDREHGSGHDPAEGLPDGAIVVGFDGSEGGWHALEWAAAESDLRRCPLVVLHADLWSAEALGVPVFGQEAAYEEGLLDRGVRAVRAARPEVEVAGLRCRPPAGEALVHASEGASLLVVGSRGLSYVQQLVVGSVSRHCVDHARCPVVVVRGVTGPAGVGAAVEEGAGHPSGVDAEEGASSGPR